MFSLGLNGIAKTCRCSSQPACLYTDKIFIPIRTKKGHRYVRRPFYMEQARICSTRPRRRSPGASFYPFLGGAGVAVPRVPIRGGIGMETKYVRLKAFVAENGWPRYRFNQILHAVFKERIGEFDRMTTLPLPLRHQLRKRFGKSVLHLTPVFRKQSGQADKVLFELPDSNKIETVRLIYRAGWQSYCISSQCGCGFGCRFCATGRIGLKRNLSADEITDQILYFHLQSHPIDSISLMGMGEALANPQIFTALKVLTDPRLFNLSPRRITVSTIGLVP